jgi:hypothetical protein
MTVGQLIEKLQAYDPGLMVVVGGYEFTGYSGSIYMCD